MDKYRIGLIVSLSIAMITVIIGFFGLADIIQWVVNFPEGLTYWAFNNRFLLMGVGILALITFIIINTRIKFISLWASLGIVILYIGLFVAGFLGPGYIMFQSDHHSAEFIENQDVPSHYIKGDDEVMVVVNNGDARAFPNKWIVQTHIAGDNIGGDDIVMTYCGLSHVGRAFDSKHNGEELNLKVLTQLENNLVMFDENSNTPITQVYGTLDRSEESLSTVSSVTMPYSSFKTLYPEGQVYYFMPNSVVEKNVYKMLDNVIYAEGGQYDKNTDKLSFNTIKHNDTRLHAKEQVYGLEINGQSIAITKEYLIANDNVVVKEVNGQFVTFKYFEDLDFVNIFSGKYPEVDAFGKISDREIQSLPHHNGILWKVWANFYPETDLLG